MNGPHYLQSILDKKDDCPASSLKVFGRPLIVHNILIAQNILKIDTVSIPDAFSPSLFSLSYAPNLFQT